MFNELKEKWEKGYITAETLQGWVRINEKRPEKGITPEEYELITGEPYVPINE